MRVLSQLLLLSCSSSLLSTVVVAQGTDTATSVSVTTATDSSSSPASSPTSSSSTTSTTSATASTTTATTTTTVGGLSDYRKLLALVDPAKYDSNVRPGAGSGLPTTVYSQFRLNRLIDVNPATNTFDMDLFITMSWIDPRLQFPPTINDSIYLDPTLIWTPDTLLYNTRKATTIVDEASWVNSRTGTVFWRRHYDAKLGSGFQLQDFPYDSQTLKIQFMPFSRANVSIIVDFFPDIRGGAVNPEASVTFQSNTWVLMSQGNKSLTIATNPGFPNNQYYGGVEVDLFIYRDSSTYVLHYILPLFFIAFCSTLTYWVDLGAVPARVGFGTALLVATIFLNFVVSKELPKVNYATKMDYYVLTVFIFVLMALLEFTIAHVLKSNNHILAQKAFESFFRYASTVGLVGAWLIVTYGTGNTTSPAAMGVGGALLGVAVIVALVLSILEYVKAARVAAAKKYEK